MHFCQVPAVCLNVHVHCGEVLHADGVSLPQRYAIGCPVKRDSAVLYRRSD